MKNGHVDVVKYILKAGGDVKVQNGAGKTPMDIAVERNSKEMIELLTSPPQPGYLHVYLCLSSRVFCI